MAVFVLIKFQSYLVVDYLVKIKSLFWAKFYVQIENLRAHFSIPTYFETLLIRIKIRKVLFFGPEKCLKEFKSRVGVAPKKGKYSGPKSPFDT